MKKISLLVFIIAFLISCNSKDKASTDATASTENTSEAKDSTALALNKKLVSIDTDEALIATALMAAPKEARDGATVIGYNMAGEFVTFKEGTNEYICLVDNAKQDGFNAACYHKSLDPFMARGRALRAEGKTGKEIFDIREEEVKSGKLLMGEPGTTLHIYYGNGTMYHPETGEVDGAQYRYVVYLPFATSETTGLPEKPLARNHPWIMNPGTHRAHIMISPLADKTE